MGTVGVVGIIGAVLGIVNLGLRFWDKRRERRAQLVIQAPEKFVCGQDCPRRRTGQGAHLRFNAHASSEVLLSGFGLVDERLWWIRRGRRTGWEAPDPNVIRVSSSEATRGTIELDPAAWARFRGRSVRIRVRTSNGTLYFSAPITIPDEDMAKVSY